MRKGIDHFEEKRIDFLVNLLLYTRCIKIAAARRWPIVERRGVAVVAVISPRVSITAPTNFSTYRRKSCLVNSTKPPLSSPSSSNENLFIVSWWEVRIQN